MSETTEDSKKSSDKQSPIYLCFFPASSPDVQKCMENALVTLLSGEIVHVEIMMGRNGDIFSITQNTGRVKKSKFKLMSRSGYIFFRKYISNSDYDKLYDFFVSCQGQAYDRCSFFCCFCAKVFSFTGNNNPFVNKDQTTCSRLISQGFQHIGLDIGISYTETTSPQAIYDAVATTWDKVDDMVVNGIRGKIEN